MNKHYLVIFFLIIFSVHANAQIYNWAKCLKGTCSINYLAGESVCHDLAIDADKNVYITGNFSDTVDFDPGPNTAYLICPYSSLNGADYIYFAKYDSSGNYIWAKAIELKQYGWGVNPSIAIDGNNDIYLSGDCTGSADFDPDTGTAILYNTRKYSNGYLFMAKYDSSGHYIWAKELNDPLNFSLSLDDNSNIYITGNFYDSLDVDPSSNIVNVYSKQWGVFFGKYDFNGNYIWAKALTVGQHGGASTIKYDKGSVLVAGYFGGTIDFNPNGGGAIVSVPYAAANRFVAKYDSAGNYSWNSTIDVSESGGYSTFRGIHLATDQFSNVIVTGNFSTKVDILSDGNHLILNGPIYTPCTYICKYGYEGNLLWAKAILSNDFVISTSIDVDVMNNIYIAGSFTSADFDPGPGVQMLYRSSLGSMDYFAKYDANGNYIWAAKIGDGGYGGSNTYPVIKVGNGEQYIGGFFDRTADFDPSPNLAILNGCFTSSFFAKYSSPLMTTIDPIIINSNLSIYPNPLTSSSILQLNTQLKNAEVVIYDMLGKEMVRKKMSGDRMEIERGSLESGIYFVRVSGEERQWVEKIVVE